MKWVAIFVLVLTGCSSPPGPIPSAVPTPEPTALPEVAKPEDFGFAQYPGAVERPAERKQGTAIYLTTDPMPKVVAYFEKQLGKGARNMSSEIQGTPVTILSKGSITVTITRFKGEAATHIAISKGP